MALLERLAILITADAAGALSEMKKVAAGAEKDLGKAGAEGSSLAANMTKVGAGMVAAGAGLLAVGVASANTATDLGREVKKLQRYTGMTAEEASKLAFAAKESGVPVDSLATGLGKLSKSMEAGSPVFDRMGISARDSQGKLRSMGDILPDLAEQFKNMPNGPEKTADALGLFGRAGMDLMPFLNKGKEGIKQLSDEASKMGLVLSQDNIDQITHHIVAQRELSAAIDGVKTKIGLAMIPVLDTLTDTMKNIPEPVYNVIGPLTVFGGLGLTAAGGISLIVGQLGKLKTMAVNAYDGVSTMMTKMMAMPAAFGIAAVAVAVIAGAFLLLRKHLDDVSTSAKKAQGDLSGFSTDELKKQLADVNTEMDKLGPKETEMILGVGEAIRRSFTGDDELYAKLKGKKSALEDALAAVETSSSKTRTLADAEKAAAEETTNHSDAIKNLNDVMNKSLDPFLNAISAADKVGESQRKLKDETLKVFYAQLNLNEAEKDHGKNSPEAVKASEDLAQANRDLDAAQAGAFKSAIDYEQSLGTLMGQMKDHPEIYQQNIDKITKMYAEGKISADVFERMRSKLVEIAIASGALPDVKVNVDSSMVDEAIQKIFALNKAAHTPTAYNFSSLPGYGGWSGNAMGGRIFPGAASGTRAGGPHLVGELGPEIFFPDSAGTIVTAEKTKQMLSSSGAGNTAVYNINVNVSATADKAAIGQSIVESIAAYERRSGDGWRAA